MNGKTLVNEPLIQVGKSTDVPELGRPVRLPTVTEDPTMTRVLSNRNLNRSIHVGLGALLGCYVYWPEFREHPAGAITPGTHSLPAALGPTLSTTSGPTVA